MWVKRPEARNPEDAPPHPLNKSIKPHLDLRLADTAPTDDITGTLQEPCPPLIARTLRPARSQFAPAPGTEARRVRQRGRAGQTTSRRTTERRRWSVARAPGHHTQGL